MSDSLAAFAVQISAFRRTFARLFRSLAPVSFGNSYYTGGISCFAADGSPDSICDKMRVTSDMPALCFCKNAPVINLTHPRQ